MCRDPAKTTKVHSLDYHIDSGMRDSVDQRFIFTWFLEDIACRFENAVAYESKGYNAMLVRHGVVPLTRLIADGPRIVDLKASHGSAEAVAYTLV